MRRPRRKAEDTRAEILDTAEQLFANAVFPAALLPTLHSAWNVACHCVQTLYSKVALADAICDRRVAKMAAGLKTLETNAPAPHRLGIVARRLMELHLAGLTKHHSCSR